MTDWLSSPLTSPPLSPRAYRCLTEAGYRTFADVDAAPPSDRHREPKPGNGRKVPGLGPLCTAEVLRRLQEARREQVRELLAAGKSLRQIATLAGVSHECVRKWLREAKESS